MSSEPANIFEAVGRMAQKDQEGKEKKPLVFEEMLRRCISIHEKLQTSVDTLLSQHHVLPSQYQEYIARPQNFSEEEWTRLEEQRRRNEQMLKDLRQQIGKKPQVEEKKEPIKSGTKPKIVRRRHWLDMH
jgi:hypothetical protein